MQIINKVGSGVRWIKYSYYHVKSPSQMGIKNYEKAHDQHNKFVILGLYFLHNVIMLVSVLINRLAIPVFSKTIVYPLQCSFILPRKKLHPSTKTEIT